MIKLTQITREINSGTETKLPNGNWVPARPYRLDRTFKEFISDIWLVATGKGSVLWPK